MASILSPEPTIPKPHEKYWLEDGSLVLRSQATLYKVHRTLLHRHSPVLASLGSAANGTEAGSLDGVVAVTIPEERGVKDADLDVLLEHLYHDVPLDHSAPFQRIASLLRVSSKQQLDFPNMHSLARSHLERLFPNTHDAFTRSEHAEQALALSAEYDILSIRKPLYYTVATHPHEHNLDEASGSHPALPSELAARCDTLLEQLIGHFTPILFTVATAGHMACTDVLAEKWMPLVIQPALDDNGLCRPLETLDRVIAINWEKEGLCAECVRDKADEWRAEQKTVWEAMDGWLR